MEEEQEEFSSLLTTSGNYSTRSLRVGKTPLAPARYAQIAQRSCATPLHCDRLAHVSLVTRGSLGPEIPITFRLRQRGKRWFLFDIAAPGVSLISHYRRRFDQILQRRSVQELVEQMRQAVETADSSQELQPLPDLQLPGRRFFIQILEFISTFSHWLGKMIVGIIQRVVPDLYVPDDLVDPIGLLATLTIFLALSTAFKTIIWSIVVIGWVLIVIRIFS